MFAVARMRVGRRCGCFGGRSGRCRWGVVVFGLWLGRFFGVGAPTADFFDDGVAFLPRPYFFVGEGLVANPCGGVGK